MGPTGSSDWSHLVTAVTSIWFVKFIREHAHFGGAGGGNAVFQHISGSVKQREFLSGNFKILSFKKCCVKKNCITFGKKSDKKQMFEK